MNLTGLISAFEVKNFTLDEIVALSGAQTIGLAKCKLFLGSIYSDENIDPLQGRCSRVGSDHNLPHIDTTISYAFDNAYYQILVLNKGLIHSNREFFASGRTNARVLEYAFMKQPKEGKHLDFQVFFPLSTFSFPFLQTKQIIKLPQLYFPRIEPVRCTYGACVMHEETILQFIRMNLSTI